MKNGLIIIVFTLLVSGVHADITEKVGVRYKAYIDPFDVESIKRGAKIFADKCLACHSLKFMRFKRIADDTAWSEADIQKEMIRYSRHPNGNLYNTVESQIPPDITANIFNTVPPDLSLIARSKGTDYLLNYFLNYYQDNSRIFGANNALLENTTMPNVLVTLQGERVALRDQQGRITGYTVVKEGELNRKAFYNYVTDLIHFLDYVGEPSKAQRYKTGWWVIAFTLLLGVFAFLLKQNYWQDVRHNK